LPDDKRIDRRFAALIDTSRLRTIYALSLALLSDIRLKLSYGGEHAQQQLAGSGRRVHASLLQAPKVHSLLS
jgi:hypothetical protein